MASVSTALVAYLFWVESKPPTAHTTAKLRRDVGGKRRFLFSHKQLYTECVGGNNVKYATQNHRSIFLNHMEFPWYTCQLPATYSPAYADSFSTVGSQRKFGSISQMCSYYVQHDLQLIEDFFFLFW